MKRERVVLAGHRLMRLYSFDSVSHLVRAECKCGWSGSFRHAQRGRDAYREHLLFEKEAKNPENNCPDGYLLNTGRPIDMLGKSELWRIFEHHAEPDLTRIPQDLVDAPFGHSAKRVPKEWGRVLYYKVL